MKTNIKLGQIMGVQVGPHYSWFIITLLVVLSLVGQFSLSYSDWDRGMIWASAIATGLLFFAAILVHERPSQQFFA